MFVDCKTSEKKRKRIRPHRMEVIMLDTGEHTNKINPFIHPNFVMRGGLWHSSPAVPSGIFRAFSARGDGTPERNRCVTLVRLLTFEVKLGC